MGHIRFHSRDWAQSEFLPFFTCIYPTKFKELNISGALEYITGNLSMTSLVFSSLSAFLLKGSSKALTTKLIITAYSASCGSRILACSFAQMVVSSLYVYFKNIGDLTMLIFHIHIQQTLQGSEIIILDTVIFRKRPRK